MLEKKYFEFDGLNLTWETLEGLVKHNGPVTNNIPQTISDLNDEFNFIIEKPRFTYSKSIFSII